MVLPETCFYVESGGQVSDTGIIRSIDDSWEIEITDMRKPAAGLIVHVGKVVQGEPKVGDEAIAICGCPAAQGYHAQPYRHPPAAR